MMRELDFERPVLELERQIEELRRLAAGRDRLSNLFDPDLMVTQDLSSAEGDVGRSSESGSAHEESDPETEGARLAQQISRLEERAATLKAQIFSSLSPWQIVQLARHPQRPYTLDHVALAFTDFVELHGDRAFGDDAAIVGGLARLKGDPVMVVGHQKGRTTSENVRRNFGMPRPEGYRKALRLMRMAERFGVPIVALIDTPGAFPGLDAEERGQAQAIAECLEGMAELEVPVVAAVIGEGGSGGALAIGVANRILMLEYSIYSVISPEGCASILFKDASFAEMAADALKLTAPDLLRLGVVDQVIPEGLGGAHRDPAIAAKNLADALHAQLTSLASLSPAALVEDRYRRFRSLGALAELTPPAPRAVPRFGLGGTRTSHAASASDPSIEPDGASAVPDVGPFAQGPER